MATENFDEVTEAYQKVKQTGAALSAEYNRTTCEIKGLEAELEALPMAPLPFDDLKEAILDYIDNSGERYAEKYVKPALIDLATGMASGLSEQNLVANMGKPISFYLIEGASSGECAELSHVRIAHRNQGSFNDLVLNFFCGQLVREGLRKIMDRMSPIDFGYDRIHPDKIGTPRKERRVAIGALKQRIDELNNHKNQLASKILALGFSLPSGVNK